MPAVPLTILGLLILVAVAAPFLTSYDPLKQNLSIVLQPPAWAGGGSLDHILGTDTFGRDVLARMLYGARTSLLVVGFSLSIAVTVGAAVGLLAGYVGGWVDSALMRLVDIMLALPAILIALAVAIAVGPSLRNVVLILGFLIWPNIARLIRGETMVLKHNDFVKYAKAIAVPRWVILARHMFPNILPTLLVATTLETAHIILLEASLSFLGAGVPPPTPSWGAMIDEGRALIATGWWLALLPGLAIVVTVVTFNALGDWTRDHADPRTRNG